MPRESKVELVRPVVTRREQVAYEVLSLQRSAEPGCMIDDYVEDCANYVAKRILITILNKMDDVRELLKSKENRSLELHVLSHEENEDTEDSEVRWKDHTYRNEVPVIRWEHPVYHELCGEINLATSYGYLFARDVVYFYPEWFEALIDALQYLLDYSGEMDEEDESHYKWYIKVEN